MVAESSFVLSKSDLRESIEERGLELVTIHPLVSTQFTEIEVQKKGDPNLILVFQLTRMDLAERTFTEVVDGVIWLAWRAIKGGGAV